LACDTRKGRGQVAQQTFEGACQDYRPRNEDIIMARLGCTGEHLPCGLHKTAARPIASDRVAHSPARRETQADRRFRFGSVARPDLKHERRGHPTTPGRSDRKKFAPPLETCYRSFRLASIIQADVDNRRSAGQPLTAPGAPAGDDAATANRCHARAKPVPPLANDVARLISTLHDRPLANPRLNRSAV